MGRIGKHHGAEQVLPARDHPVQPQRCKVWGTLIYGEA